MDLNRSYRPLTTPKPKGIAGPASNLTVILSGVHGETAAQLSKRLTAKGVLGERILFCDYF